VTPRKDTPLGAPSLAAEKCCTGPLGRRPRHRLPRPVAYFGPLRGKDACHRRHGGAESCWHDPTELLTRAVQPALWLLVFGQVFTRIHAIPTGNVPYIDFMAPGILSQSVLFIAIFYGISVIWERDLGILHKFLVSPTPRSALVLGKAISRGPAGDLHSSHRVPAGRPAGRRMTLDPARAACVNPRRPAEIALPSTRASAESGLRENLCSIPRSLSQMTDMP